MALTPEEAKKRRALRAQKQEKRKKQRRKLYLRLGMVAAALLAVILIISAISSAVEKKRNQPVDPSQLTVIHLAAAGDLNVSDAIVESGGADLNYNELFMDVAHLLADADISVVNFEGTVSGEPYGESKSVPVSMMQALAAAGVDLVQLSNSYSIYRGMSGLNTTIDNVRAAGMEPLGVYKNNAEFRKSGGYTICEVQGVRVAFVAFTKGMDGMALPEGSENCVNVLYTDYSSTYQQINEEGITRVLTAVAEEKPDITIAMLHWGSEFNDTLSASQQEILNIMQGNGVNVILGTHSHYVQQIVHDTEKNTFVAYSLGDFVSDTNRPGTEYSVILNLEITKNNKTGATTVTGYDYTPIYTVAEANKPVRVVRIAETMTAYDNNYIGKVLPATYSGMTYALSRIETRIKGE